MVDASNVARPRVLELGSWHYCKDIYPDDTDVLWTGERPIPRGREGRGFVDCTPWRFFQTMRDVRRGKYDLIIIYLPLRPAWLPRYWLRAYFRQPLRPFAAMTRVFGVSWFRLVSPSVPVAVMDMNDAFIVGSHNFFLLDKATIAFKRELPVDRWHILCHSAHPALPTTRIRKSKKWIRRMLKIRPISLPADPVDTAALWEGEHPEKTCDVFFSGDITQNSWVRRVGIDELESLKAKGFKIDIARDRVPHAEFLARLSQAWLAWSPSGYSWECYRTAEAAQVLTVPVVNFPTVERHAPLQEGKHVVYYDVAPGSLTEAITRALEDKPKLRQMALAARDHVQQHHLQKAMIDHVISETRRAKNG